MSLSRSGCWTWTALAAWLGNAGLAIALAAGLVWGPLIADRAWDQGAHVTPAQAALHAALIASGFAHHHGGAVPQAAGRSAGPGFQAGGAGTTWGTPLSQALPAIAGPCATLAGCAFLVEVNQLPQQPLTAPLSPPPEASLIF